MENIFAHEIYVVSTRCYDSEELMLIRVLL